MKRNEKALCWPKSQHTDQPNITVEYATEIIDIFVFYYNELVVLYNT